MQAPPIVSTSPTAIISGKAGSRPIAWKKASISSWLPVMPNSFHRPWGMRKAPAVRRISA